MDEIGVFDMLWLLGLCAMIILALYELGKNLKHPRVIATKGGITMLQPSSFALFLFLGAYLLYCPGMKPETVGILWFCVGAGLISMGLALFGHHPWVKKWLNRLF